MNARIFFLLSMLALPGLREVSAAGFTEPPITFYGKITNTFSGYSVPVTSGQLVWTIQPTTGSSFDITTPLSALTGGYSYRLLIPVEKVPTGFTLSSSTIATAPSSANYTRSFITLDGLQATIVSPTLPAGGTFTFAENQRGKIERVDLGTSTAFLDSDGDALPDWWEILYGLNPFDPNDAARDDDGDGMTNLQEYIAGTNPKNANDSLRITKVEKPVIGITWTSVPGRNYRVDAADDLTATFTPLSATISAGPGELTKSFTDPTPGVLGKRFYKVVVVP